MKYLIQVHVSSSNKKRYISSYDECLIENMYKVKFSSKTGSKEMNIHVMRKILKLGREYYSKNLFAITITPIPIL